MSQQQTMTVEEAKQGVQQHFGYRRGETGYNPRYDLNQDDIIDTRDMAYVAYQTAPTPTPKPKPAPTSAPTRQFIGIKQIAQYAYRGDVEAVEALRPYFGRGMYQAQQRLIQRGEASAAELRAIFGVTLPEGVKTAKIRTEEVVTPYSFITLPIKSKLPPPEKHVVIEYVPPPKPQPTWKETSMAGGVYTGLRVPTALGFALPSKVQVPPLQELVAGVIAIPEAYVRPEVPTPIGAGIGRIITGKPTAYETGEVSPFYLLGGLVGTYAETKAFGFVVGKAWGGVKAVTRRVAPTTTARIGAWGARQTAKVSQAYRLSRVAKTVHKAKYVEPIYTIRKVPEKIGIWYTKRFPKGVAKIEAMHAFSWEPIERTFYTGFKKYPKMFTKVEITGKVTQYPGFVFWAGWKEAPKHVGYPILQSLTGVKVQALRFGITQKVWGPSVIAEPTRQLAGFETWATAKEAHPLVGYPALYRKLKGVKIVAEPFLTPWQQIQKAIEKGMFQPMAGVTAARYVPVFGKPALEVYRPLTAPRYGKKAVVPTFGRTFFGDETARVTTSPVVPTLIGVTAKTSWEAQKRYRETYEKATKEEKTLLRVIVPPLIEDLKRIEREKEGLERIQKRRYFHPTKEWELKKEWFKPLIWGRKKRQKPPLIPVLKIPSTQKQRQPPIPTFQIPTPQILTFETPTPPTTTPPTRTPPQKPPGKFPLLPPWFSTGFGWGRRELKYAQWFFKKHPIATASEVANIVVGTPPRRKGKGRRAVRHRTSLASYVLGG